MTYAAEGPDPVLPVRACMTANVALRFTLLSGIPVAARRHAIRDITDAPAEEALAELPVHRFRLEKIAAAHEAVEGRALGKVVIDLT